jgi:hypothetical protein
MHTRRRVSWSRLDYPVSLRRGTLLTVLQRWLALETHRLPTKWAIIRGALSQACRLHGLHCGKLRQTPFHPTCVYNGLIRLIEYAFYYYFYQDGTIGYSIRLTGILNTYILAPGESSAPFGTTIAPNITAHYHQHIFSLRIDPMIDGVCCASLTLFRNTDSNRAQLKNSVIETDVVSFAAKTGSVDNYAGNGFTVESRTIQTEGEGARAYDAIRDRRYAHR